MKKIILLPMAIMAALTLSCTREDPARTSAEPQTGELLIHVFPDGISTKAGTPDISSQSHETRVRKVDIYVFDENGLLNLHHWDDDSSLEDIRLSVSTGTKEVWAVLNGPTLGGIVRVSDLKEAVVSMEDNQATASGGTFTMAGSNTCTVTASGTTPCSITADRFVARVRLTKVKVNLPTAYGSVDFPSVMLTNVVADRKIGENAGTGRWINKKGRTEQGRIIDGSASAKASAEAVTFLKWNRHVNNGTQLDLSDQFLCFYGFENPATEDKTGTDGSFLEEPTRLVLTAIISGGTYYYPVTLPNLQRNRAYEVELTITGLGSDDPDIVPKRGSVNADITILPWKEGIVVNETI